MFLGFGKKIAVVINGIAAPMTGDHFLIKWLKNAGYEVKTVEPMAGETIEKIKDAPAVIIGWSFGGMLAPKLAEKYPKAKLIMIATGARVEPIEQTAQILFDLVKNDWGVKFLYWGLKLPEEWLTMEYRKLNRMPESEGGVWKLLIDNIEFFRGLSMGRIGEVVGILAQTDNRELLAKLTNKTLIFGGKDDKLMPISLVKEMKELIANSRLVVTEGNHFDVVREEQIVEMAKFLEVK